MAATMTMNSHYPPPDYVAGIYHYRTVGNYDKMMQYFSKDFISETCGNHPLAGSGGIDHSKEVAKKLDNLLDPSKSSKTEIVRVIGGGEQSWSSVVLKSTGTTKAGKSSSSTGYFSRNSKIPSCMRTNTNPLFRSGKKFSHEYVLLVRFDLDWKIAEIRAFHDTAGLKGHLDDSTTM